MSIISLEQAISEFAKVQDKSIFFDDLLRESEYVQVYRENVTLTGKASILDLIPEQAVSINIVVIDGDLTVEGCLSNITSVVNRGGGINLLVLGNLVVNSLISTQATIYVRGNLTAHQAIYLFFGDGTSSLFVDGLTKTRAYLINDEHFTNTFESEEEFYFDLYEADYDEVCAAFVDEIIGAEDTKIEHHALIEHLENEKNIFRS
jgi:hypothetical protein